MDRVHQRLKAGSLVPHSPELEPQSAATTSLPPKNCARTPPRD
jgi:hypothetical protein